MSTLDELIARESPEMIELINQKTNKILAELAQLEQDEPLAYYKPEDAYWITNGGLVKVCGQPTPEHTVPVYRKPQQVLLEPEITTDHLWETLIKISDYLNIDPEEARKIPGKPSDVFIAAIEALRGNQ